MTKQTKGITLIALVITIIVLLILAGVTIVTLTGDNGLLSKASDAKQANENSTLEEKIKLAYMEYNLEKRTNPNVDIEQFTKNSLEKTFNESITTEKVGNSLEITFNDRNKKYKYTPNGTVIELMDSTKNLYGKLDKTTQTLYLRATQKDNYDLFNKYSSAYYIIERNWDKEKIKKIVIEEPIAPSTTYMMFSGCNYLTAIEGIKNLHTENSDTMYAMFLNCSSLIDIDISNFDTSNVNSMQQMFQGCNSLKHITIGHLETGNVTKMSSMFLSCRELTNLDISSFDTHNVTTINSMFGDCKKLTEIDLSNFDTTSLTDMNYAFEKTLNNLNLSGKFKLNENTSYSSMFGWVGSNENLSIKIKCSSEDETKIRNAYPNLTDKNFE